MKESVETHIKYISRDIKEIKGRIKNVDTKLEEHLMSHNKDKEMWAKAIEDEMNEYAKESDVAPLLEFWSKLQTFSVGFVVLVGASVLGLIAFGRGWIKQKLGV